MATRWMTWVVLLVAVAVPARAAADTTAPLQRPRAMTEPPVRTAVAAPAAAAPAADAPAAEAPATVEPPQPTAIAPAPAAGPAPAASPAPTAASTPPAPRASHAGETGLRKSAAPRPAKFSHEGFTVDGRVGTMGCIRGLCNGGLNVRPGIRLDGFVGGNIRGFVDFGLAGGWGAMSSDVAAGTNVLSLYGLDPALLQTALGALAGQALGIDLPSLTVTDTKLRAAQVGPLLRVHFIPRGRFAAYVGSGVYYNLFRARYGTAAGDTRVDFHGLAVPVQGGFGVHVQEHVAVGVQFDYLWTWYALANLDHAGQSLTVPVRILDDAARMQNVALRSQLPQFWTFAFTLRARI